MDNRPITMPISYETPKKIQMQKKNSDLKCWYVIYICDTHKEAYFFQTSSDCHFRFASLWSYCYFTTARLLEPVSYGQVWFLYLHHMDSTHNQYN